MLHDFYLAGERVRLWQRQGETYEHVLMKALGYAMFIKKHPRLEIEKKVGLRYKPDLVVQNGERDFDFWGECGANSIRKTHWILKHTYTKKLVLFKIAPASVEQLIEQLRSEIPEKYRTKNRLVLINFVSGIVKLTESQQIAKVSQDWFSEMKI